LYHLTKVLKQLFDLVGIKPLDKKCYIQMSKDCRGEAFHGKLKVKIIKKMAIALAAWLI
jgi:hypothetical protein